MVILVIKMLLQTYNVGNISGGTSINTIAQSAKMLCEYRSDNEECLLIMKKKFEKIFADAATGGLDIKVSLIGDRPCMGKVDLSKIAHLTEIYRKIIKETTQKEISCHSGSTDCNIPLSLGIPALCVGVYRGGGMHTRQEWIDKTSLPTGLEVGIKMILGVIKNI